VADDLLQAAFDRDPPGPPVPPACSYLVCSTPRSGSTLLCEGLRATGRLGVPTEYFNIDASVVPLSVRWGSTTATDFVRDLYRFRTSQEGVFGTKLHWQQVEEMRDDLGLGRLAGEGPFPARERAMLDALFPGARHVHVYRQDRHRQAVSYWIAEHTRQWSVHIGEEPPPADPPAYDYDAIEALRAKVEHGEACWARYFEENGVEPIRVSYDDLSCAYAEVIASVACALGMDVSPADVPPPRLRRQTNPYGDQVVERYRSERTAGPQLRH